MGRRPVYKEMITKLQSYFEEEGYRNKMSIPFKYLRRSKELREYLQKKRGGVPISKFLEEEIMPDIYAVLDRYKREGKEKEREGQMFLFVAVSMQSLIAGMTDFYWKYIKIAKNIKDLEVLSRLNSNPVLLKYIDKGKPYNLDILYNDLEAINATLKVLKKYFSNRSYSDYLDIITSLGILTNDFEMNPLFYLHHLLLDHYTLYGLEKRKEELEEEMKGKRTEELEKELEDLENKIAEYREIAEKNREEIEKTLWDLFVQMVLRGGKVVSRIKGRRKNEKQQVQDGS